MVNFNLFEFDDFDAERQIEEMIDEPTEADIQAMMAEGEWEAIPMFPYDEAGYSASELADICRSLGFEVIEFD